MQRARTPHLRGAVTATVAVAATLLAALPVAAEAPAGRYVVSGGTVVDRKTGLAWQQVAPPSLFNWAEAKTYCATAAGLPGAGWRLPTVKELATLLDFSKPQDFFIDTTVFNVPTSSIHPNGVFWTATPFVGRSPTGWTDGAWNVYFKAGVTYYNDIAVGAWARCVR